MTLNELKARQNDLQHINILSNEGDIYLVEAVLKDSKIMLLDDSGSPLRYNGVNHVKECFESLSVPEFKLVFDSPYEEI